MKTTRTTTGSRDLRTMGIVALAALLVLLFGAGASLAATKTFRQGENGYAGAKDTMLQQSAPNASNAGVTPIGWDSDDPSGTGQDVYTLLRFDDVFGLGADQVPPGAVITQATLSYYVSDTGDAAGLHEPLVDWADTATYSGYCGGDGCYEGTDYGPATGSATAAVPGTVSIDVTITVQSWASGATNRGWMVIPTGSDGVDIASSESATVANRPLLTIRHDEGSPGANLLRQPYLQLGTPTSMTVAWRTDTATASVVEYGTTLGSYPSSATGASGTNHFVTVTDLSPGTKYFYRLGSGGSQLAGGADYYFVTSPAPGTTTPFRFWVFGDSGICSSIQTTVLNSMLAYTGGNPPDLFLHTGDVAQSIGADSEYTNCHLAYYQSVMRHTPFWPTMGNHDSYSTSCSGTPLSCTGPYFSTFVLPSSAQAGGHPSGTEAYYSWDYGTTHFIVLDGVHDRSATGPMATWLAQDLDSASATGAQWIIAYWHQPPYTKGTHDSDTEIECREMRENIVPILEAGGVDLVLNGHSHGYERSYLIDGAYATPTPTFGTLVSQGKIVDSGTGRPPSDQYSKPPGQVPHAGTVYTVVATGGQPPGGAHNHPVMFYSESANGSAIVDVGATTLTLNFLRADGSVRDTVVIEKGPRPPRVSESDPPKSSVLSAVPSVAVTFTTAVTGVEAADLTVNGTAATSVTGSGAGPYLFTGYGTPSEGAVDVELAAGGIADAIDPGLVFEGDAWRYTIDTSPPVVVSEIPERGATIGTLASVTITFSKPVVNVSADDVLVNGVAATSVLGVSGTPGPYSFTGFAKPADGIVNIEVLADGIQDTQVPAKAFAGDSWIYKLTRRLIINEFLASNNTAATDENGEYDDYLEIYNPTREPVDMSGMFLTDDLDTPALFRIPDGVIAPPLGYVVFWCDARPSQGPLHTNFSILRAGEDLGLYDTEANGLAPIDTLTFATQTTDVASGRFPDGADGFVSMPVTPNAPNTIGCSIAADCAALNGPCSTGACTGNRCVSLPANEGLTCDDGVACTTGDVCVSGTCNNGTDDCPIGETCNRTTGACESETIDALPILAGETWRYLKGTAEPTPLANPPAWAAPAYDDLAWLAGPSGFGYGPDCTAQRGTLLPDMQSADPVPGYLSLYLRKSFLVDNPALVTSLTLTMDYDDGFVVYINGQEVVRRNVIGTPPAYNQVATADHECSSVTPTNLETIDLTAHIGKLVAGENVIAIQAHNLNLASSDLTLLPTLSSTELAGCTFNSDCIDGNLCTDDLCSAGICVNSNDDTNSCSDGLACTNDACSGGTCVATDSCTGGRACNHSTGVCEFQTSPVTVTFQDGAGGYGGTSDTYIDAALGSQATAAVIVVDNTPVEQILVRFDGIFGSGTGQVPVGSNITAATLTLRVGDGTADQSANPVNFHRLLHPWIDTDVWAAYGVAPWNVTAGIQADGIDAVSTAEATATMSTASTAYLVSVLGSLQAWSIDPLSNCGWVILPTGPDGLRLVSSESPTVSYRPILSITYTPASGPCTANLDCDDGLWCNGEETCDTGAGTCQPGTAPACSDGVGCTTDTCNESADRCDNTPSDAACGDGLYCNGAETCSAVDGCQAGTPVSCPGQVCNDSLDRCADCASNTDCDPGESCNQATGLCEVAVPLQAGDVIISGFQETNAVTGHGTESEFIELFNTTDRVISLESMDVIIRGDSDPGDGDIDVDWQLSTLAPNLSGKQIAPHSFFLIAEPGVLAPGGNLHDLGATLDLTTVEGGVAERAMSIELVVNGTHMDYVLYGRHDGSTPAGELPPGDIPFAGFGGSGQTLIPLGATWLYLDDGSNQGTAWKEPAFSDGGWSQGPAELGYGDGDEATTVDCGPDPTCNDLNNNSITTYFRRHFNVADVAAYQSLSLQLERDDGAVVYLNGTEVYRVNMPTGTITSTTPASTAIEDTVTTASVSPSLLVTGDNVIAVEVHQSSASSSDISFNLGLTGVTGPAGARTEVIRNTLGGDAFLEGLVRREGASALHAGHAVEGFYTDEVALGDGYTAGVWTSPHVATYGSYEARNSLSPQELPPTCDDDSDCTDGLYCNGAEICDTGTGQCVGGTPQDCDDAVSCTADSCDEATDSCGHQADDAACNDGVACTIDLCDPVNGCLHDDSCPAGKTCNLGTSACEYDAGSPHGRIDCTPASGLATPGSNLSVRSFLTNLGDLAGIRGYQSQVSIVRTGGTGSLTLACPGGVRVEDGRADYLFTGRSDDYPATNCGLARGSSTLASGSVVVGPPAYLATYDLAVSGDASPGTTFEVRIEPYPGSELADAEADSIPFVVGNTCTITVGGCTSPAECDDGDVCTTDGCNAGTCVNTPNCGISGWARYYHTGSGGEPSTKPVPGVGIDTSGDSVANGTTDSAGLYDAGGHYGSVTVRALPMWWGVSRPADADMAVTSFDAAQISRFAVGSVAFSSNQQLAGDVSGNGAVSSFDAAKVAQFAVQIIDHFDVATATGSDWKYLRCDTYNSAADHDCTTAQYVHPSLSGPVSTDNFYAILYGDVTGNWAAGGTGLLAKQALETAGWPGPVDREALRAKAATLRPRAEDAPPAVLGLEGSSLELARGETRDLVLSIEDADGIEALDLTFHYDPSRIAIRSVRPAGLAADWALQSGSERGRWRGSLYGLLPLQGDGALLVVTVEAVGTRPTPAVPLTVSASANEGRIPVRLLAPASPVQGERRLRKETPSERER